MAPLSKTPPGPKTDASASPVKTRPAPKIEAKPAPVVRIWTSTVRTTVEAEFIGREDDVVLLKKRDGTVLRVPLDKLSEQDRQWIQQTQK
jgi:hypothetical protein